MIGDNGMSRASRALFFTYLVWDFFRHKEYLKLFMSVFYINEYYVLAVMAAMVLFYLNEQVVRYLSPSAPRESDSTGDRFNSTELLKAMDFGNTIQPAYRN